MSGYARLRCLQMVTQKTLGVRREMGTTSQQKARLALRPSILEEHLTDLVAVLRDRERQHCQHSCFLRIEIVAGNNAGIQVRAPDISHRWKFPQLRFY